MLILLPWKKHCLFLNNCPWLHGQLWVLLKSSRVLNTFIMKAMLCRTTQRPRHTRIQQTSIGLVFLFMCVSSVVVTEEGRRSLDACALFPSSHCLTSDGEGSQNKRNDEQHTIPYVFRMTHRPLFFLLSSSFFLSFSLLIS